jgi:hypothetical protein
MSYLVPEPEDEELAPEPAAPELPAPELPAPPDWPWVLPVALAPVPPLSRHSFGMSLRDAYLEASQRVSFCAAWDLLMFEPLVAGCEDVVAASVLALRSFARSPNARAEPLASAKTVLRIKAGADLRIWASKGC